MGVYDKRGPEVQGEVTYVSGMDRVDLAEGEGFGLVTIASLLGISAI